MRNSIVIASCALLLLAVSAQAETPSKWTGEIEKFAAADAKSPPPRGGVVFVGSSSIRLWKTLAEDFPGVAVINRGFGGSQIADSVEFADRIILPYEPKLVVVYAGDNDLHAGKTPEQVAADMKTLVAKIHARLPETRVAFIAIKPSLARWKMIDRVRAANGLIQEYMADDERLIYLDIVTPMLGPDGRPRGELFIEDGLHMSRQGYAVWTEVVAPILK